MKYEVKVRKIMPMRCNVCDIGIGRSVQKIDKEWVQHEHMHQNIHRVRYKKKSYNLCGRCFEKSKGVGNLHAFLESKVED